ncbi:unnamed protein product [Nezara viridula]|uniref:Uncharacterized protein n=1 Tax=Nezara viridula TaxID=85310 RepID=A0A9P0MJ42_NEZVI|nr:unnamed protein product [Nezara viridula]
MTQDSCSPRFLDTRKAPNRGIKDMPVSTTDENTPGHNCCGRKGNNRSDIWSFISTIPFANRIVIRSGDNGSYGKYLIWRYWIKQIKSKSV